MPPDAARTPPDVLASLAREHPPHRAPDAFFERLGAWRRKAADAGASRADQVLVSLSADVGSAAYGQADMMLVRSLFVEPAAVLDEVVARARKRWPTPSPGRAATIERLAALAELARLRDAGRIGPGAAIRMAYLLDPSRPPEPPADVRSYFGEAPDAPVGLREARTVVAAAAPTAWRLAAAEYTRLVDRLDPLPAAQGARP